jgi:hypothetical protein
VRGDRGLSDRERSELGRLAEGVTRAKDVREARLRARNEYMRGLHEDGVAQRDLAAAAGMSEPNAMRILNGYAGQADEVAGRVVV